MALSTGLYWIISLIVVSGLKQWFAETRKKLTRGKRYFTPPFVDSTGYVAFSFFTGFCGLSLVWTYIFVPETADRKLHQIDEAFRDTSGTEEEERKQKITTELKKLKELGDIELGKTKDAKRPQGEQQDDTHAESLQTVTANLSARSTGGLVISTVGGSGESTMVATQTNSPQETVVGTDGGQ